MRNSVARARPFSPTGLIIYLNVPPQQSITIGRFGRQLATIASGQDTVRFLIYARGESIDFASCATSRSLRCPRLKQFSISSARPFDASVAISMRTFETEKCADECSSTNARAWERWFNRSWFNGSRAHARALYGSSRSGFDGISPMDRGTERDVLAATIFQVFARSPWNCFVKYSPRLNYRRALIALIKRGPRIYADERASQWQGGGGEEIGWLH